MSSEITRVDDRSIIESLVTNGDVGGLTPEQRTQYYVSLCDKLGLNPHTQPFAVVKLQGRAVMYATRGATDQLAAIHKINREIVRGPEVFDLAGTKLVLCICKATHPNGRTETATATVPLQDPANVLMKAETKAKRRATLAILGLGMLDETEVQDIPAGAKSDATPIATGAPAGGTMAALDALGDSLASAETFDAVVACYRDHAGEIAAAENAARGDVGEALAYAQRACFERLEKRLGLRGLRTRFKAAAGVAMAPVEPTTTPEPVDVIAQYERDYARAQSKSEVEAIDREVAALRLGRESAERVRLVAARTAAVARLRGPDGGGGGTKPTAASADDVMDAMIDEERDAIATEPSAEARAAVVAWRDHAASKGHRAELRNSFWKREAEFRRLGIFDACRAIATRQLFGLLNTTSEMHALNYLMDRSGARRAA